MKILGLNNQTIKEKTIIYGVPFDAGSVVITDNQDKVKGVELANDTVINNLLFKKGTTVFFHDNGKLQRGILAINENYDTGTYKLNPIQDSTISFHSNGNLSGCKISNELNLGQSYQNIKVTGELSFSPTKEFWSGILSSTVRITQYDKEMGLLTGQPIVFESKGGEPRIVAGWLNDDIELKYVIAKGKQYISFYPGDSLTSMGPIEAYFSPFQVYYDGLIVGDVMIVHYPNRNLLRGKTTQNCSYQDIDFVKNTAISLYENKMLKTVVSPREMIIQGHMFRKNTTINFREDGTVITS